MIKDKYRLEWWLWLDITLACDIMMDFDGSIRPTLCLASELSRLGNNVTMLSPYMDSGVENYLKSKQIRAVNLHARLAARNYGLSLVWFETWAREAFLKLNSRNIIDDSSIVLNFSQVLSLPCLVWYLQGPPSIALRDMQKELSIGPRTAYGVLKPFFEFADGRLVNRMGTLSSFVIANSKFCGSMYSEFGIKVDDVIYPPINCQIYRPSTQNPSSDYALTYLGKETKFSIVKKVASMGVKIKAFGSKMLLFQNKLAGQQNIEFLGRLELTDLIDVYSNALFTLFPFTHEPFGYVPLESMSCGTPAITYNFQGPSEYVKDNKTGWLARSDRHLVEKAVEIWKNGYDPQMRSYCRKEALDFDERIYVEKWLKILENLSKIYSNNKFRRVNSVAGGGSF